MAERILIVEDEDTLRMSLKRVFSREGYTVETAEKAEDAYQLLETSTFDLILTDILLPGVDGIELLRRVRERSSEQLTVIMTAYASLETAVEALRAGAYDYVVKPIIHEEIKQIVANALRQKALQSENAFLKKQIKKEYDFSTIVGESQAIQDVIEEVKKIAAAKSCLLLLGETGTGKELIARSVHFSSNRAEKPFIPINCSAIQETLLESELFGHLRGAFTGAVNSKKGLFEEADGGTVFLDEIGDLGPGLQAKLLRVLEDQEIRPIGANHSVKVDVRFIAATNKEIETAVREGRFREDLYYRVNVITIKLPPLRERKGDVRILAGHFLKKYADDMGIVNAKITDNAMEALVRYPWPGNIRELRNIIERAVLISGDGIVNELHLPDALRRDEASLSEECIRKKMTIEDYTKALILSYQSDHNEQEIADMLGITRKSLWEKRKRWGMPR